MDAGSRPTPNAATTLLQDGGLDPEAVDWAHVSLPPAWPDRLNLRQARDLAYYVARLFGRRRPVELPTQLRLRRELPAYLLQEFHHLPNGNYSLRLSDIYVTWFDRSMLGTMKRGRGRIVDALAGCFSVLDLGCGGAQLGQMLRQRGVAEVWGMDASPYLLHQAARRVAGVKLVQGLAEDSGFPAERFDGIGACFLFHELTPHAADDVLREAWRILKPSGLLAVTEPCPDQLHERNLWRLWRQAGLAGFYFATLARFVHEPMLDAWYAVDLRAWLDRAGFDLLSDESCLPFRTFVARKRGGTA